MADAVYRQVVRAFAAGEIVPGDVVERIDTHAAHVFLIGERAYKVKRPIRLSVLDFTTVDARKRALDEEFRLNRRTAPDLYEDVLPITRVGGGLTLDGSGAAVEWVLVMRRFPNDAQLDRIAERGPLEPSLTSRLGRFLAHFHDDLAAIRGDRGGAAAMAEVLRGNRADLAAAPVGLFAPSLVDRVGDAADGALVRHAERLDRRRAAGHVRHCHGDLHLANVVALDDRVVPFDCIEFSDEIACNDTMYDLAFLLMDLVDRGQRPAGWEVLDAYLEARSDLDGLALLPFFMAVRATIRAKVIALSVTGTSDRAAVARRARRYLSLAHKLLPASPPRLIGIGGFSGTGKTTLARRLAPRLAPAPGALVVRSDVERKRLAGVPPTTRLGPEAYTLERSAVCFDAVRCRAAAALEAGWSVIVDAVHDRAEDRDALAAVAERLGVPFQGLWLDVVEPLAVGRVATRCGDASDADEHVVRAQRALVTGVVTWRELDASSDPSSVCAAAQKILGL